MEHLVEAEGRRRARRRNCRRAKACEGQVSVGPQVASEQYSRLQLLDDLRQRRIAAEDLLQSRLQTRLRVEHDASLPQAKEDEVGPPLDRSVQRLRVEQSHLLERVGDLREARIAQRAAQDGWQVSVEPVLRQVSERVAVCDAFKGEATDEPDGREVEAEEVGAWDGDVAAG